jgi:hypothetical protein
MFSEIWPKHSDVAGGTPFTRSTPGRRGFRTKPIWNDARANGASCLRSTLPTFPGFTPAGWAVEGTMQGSSSPPNARFATFCDD